MLANTSPLCRCATSLPKGETRWTVRKTKAFLPEEGGAAQAVTEGVARKQVCIRANLMRILPICKTPSVFACGESSSLTREPSPLCRCATSLPKGETSLVCAQSKAPVPISGTGAFLCVSGCLICFMRFRLRPAGNLYDCLEQVAVNLYAAGAVHELREALRDG